MPVKAFRIALVLLVAIATGYLAMTFFTAEKSSTSTATADSIYGAPVQYATLKEAEKDLGVQLHRPLVPSGLELTLILVSKNAETSSLMVQQNWKDPASRGGILFFEERHANTGTIKQADERKTIPGENGQPDRFIRTRNLTSSHFAVIALLDGRATVDSGDAIIEAIN